MKFTCIDIGNSSIKSASWDGGEFFNEMSTATADASSEKGTLLSAMENVYADGAIAFCSVVPSASKALKQYLENSGRTYFELNHKSCGGLPIHYPKPEEIGPDRLANAIAAQRLYGTPAVVIDMGTAVTFDIIDYSGAYVGGVIAPGLNVMKEYLHSQTALLPKLDHNDFSSPGPIGKSTVDAMRTGCTIGFSGMIQAILDKVIEEMRKQDPAPPAVIATGGCVESLLATIKPTVKIDKWLTLKGLVAAAQRML